MELIYFTALLQIYAAFAFAYISVDTFHETIDRYIFKSSSILENKVKSITDKYEVVEKNLTDTRSVIKQSKYTISGKTNPSNRFLKHFENQFDKINEKQKAFEERKEEIDKKVKKWKSHSCFKQACLYSAVFCLFCLYLAGLLQVNTIDKNVIYAILFTISLMHIVVSILFVFNDITKGPAEIKLKAIYILYFWTIFTILAICWYFSFKNRLELFTHFAYLKDIAIVLAIIAPIILYLSYFARFLWIHRKCIQKVNKLVERHLPDAEEQATVSRIYKNIVKNIIGNMKMKTVDTKHID